MRLEIIVKDSSGGRLDKYLSGVTDYSRSKIGEMIDSNLITVNGTIEKSSYKVCEGDKITLPDDYNKKLI